MNEGLIQVVQLPVIEERLRDMAKEIDRQVEEALSLAVTEETVKSVKTVRASLKKQYQELEEQRKAVKRAIMEPYEAFEQIYKENISVRYEDADGEPKRKIGEVESKIVAEKVKEMKAYFEELSAASHVEWLNWERCGFKVNLTKSTGALRREAAEFVSRVAGEQEAILAMPDSEEVSAEYKRNLNLAGAIETVRARREAVEQERREREHLAEMRNAEREAAQRAREAAEQAPVLQRPKKVEEQKEELFTLTFSVTGTMEKLKLLKAFLASNGYDYE